MSDVLTHGASIVRVLPPSPDHAAALSEATLRDPLFEFVYAAVQEFADGTARQLICWRASDPSWKPGKGAGKQSAKTYLTTTEEWGTIASLREVYP